MKPKNKGLNFFNWILGNLVVCLGVCLSTKANFGLSMIAAPAYAIHVFMRNIASWYTQGTSEYIFQAAVLIVTCLIIWRFKPKYLLSFLTAVMCGLMIDGWFLVLPGGNAVVENLVVRIIFFIVGAALISLGIAFVFRSTWPAQVYEMAVLELSERFGFKRDRVKFVFDMIFLAMAIILALLLNHSLTKSGINIGTVIVTFTNAPLIALFGKVIDWLEGTVFKAKMEEINAE